MPQRTVLWSFSVRPVSTVALSALERASPHALGTAGPPLTVQSGTLALSDWPPACNVMEGAD